jgi:hypothetical protein
MPRAVHRQHRHEILLGHHRQRDAGQAERVRSRQRILEAEREGEPAVGESPVQLDEVRAAPEWRVTQPPEQRALLPRRMAATRRKPVRDECRARLPVALERHDEVEVDRLPQCDVAVQPQGEHRSLERHRLNAGALEHGPQLREPAHLCERACSARVRSGGDRRVHVIGQAGGRQPAREPREQSVRARKPLGARPVVDQRGGHRDPARVGKAGRVSRACDEQAPLTGTLVNGHRALLHRSSRLVT